MHHLRNDCEASKSSLDAKIKQRDKVIGELRRQILVRSVKTKDLASISENVKMQPCESEATGNNVCDAHEQESTPVVARNSQVAILTKTLLDKQALIEAITAEKTTLMLKVEALEVERLC